MPYYTVTTIVSISKTIIMDTAVDIKTEMDTTIQDLITHPHQASFKLNHQYHIALVSLPTIKGSLLSNFYV